MHRDDAKLRVQQSTDIVRLIGEQVALRPKGKEFAGLCPFHEDSNPSMFVSPAKQIYKCFACGAGGDVFSFVMDYHKMSFPEALKYLAERAGIELPKYGSGYCGAAGGSEEAADAPTSRKSIAKANEAALRYFRRQLADDVSGAEARAYIERRGISSDMVEAFGIGYAPDGWEHLAAAVRDGNGDLRSYDAAGLVGQRDGGNGYFDKFRHRLIFPIFDAIGRPIAFGGRKLREEDEPKYLNSAEHALFNKSATLFGLNLAKKPIIDTRTAVIVEGYTDVIACHQAGFANVVATLGTALTRQHAVELRRFCDKVVLVFDADEAGQKAADRALEVFFAEPIDVAIAVLPEGQDPAELLGRDDGPATWRATVDRAADAMAFHFDRVRRAAEATDTMTGRQRIAEEYLRRLVQLGLRKLEPTRRGMVLHHIAELLRLDTASVERMLRGVAGPARSPAPYAEEDNDQQPAYRDRPVTAPARHAAEMQLVGCLLNRPELFHATVGDGRSLEEAILPGDLEHELTRNVYQLVHDWLGEHETLTSGDLRTALEDEAALRHALDLKLTIDREVGEDQQALERTMKAAADAVARDLANRAYLDSKQTSDDDLAARLAVAVDHAKTHKDMSRLPRTTA